MKRLIFLMLLIVLCARINAQPGEVLSQLKSCKVTLPDITLHTQPTPSEYAFDMEYQTPGSDYPDTYLSIAYNL